MKKFILIFFLSWIVPISYACDCKTKSISESVERSDIIVKGTVIKATHKTHILEKTYKDSIQKTFDRLVFSDTITFVEYTLEISRTYKGEVETELITIRAEANKSNCDIRLTIGKEYLLYAYNSSWTNLYYPFDKPYFQSSICTRTTLNVKKEEKALLIYLNT